MENTNIIYRIYIREHLDDQWNDYFRGFSISSSVSDVHGPVTMLSGHIRDTSGLYGFISTLRDLGLTLLSINQERK